MTKKTTRQKKAESIQEDIQINKFKSPLYRFILVLFKYNYKEIATILALLFLGLWLLTAFSYKSKNVDIKPGVKIDLQKEVP
jgi:hypothetical protein